MVTRIIVLGVTGLLAIYGCIKVYPLVRGPELSITSPYAPVKDHFVVIEGTVQQTENLSLNGGPLLIDERGHFKEELVLPSGGAILSLTATDRFGRSITEQRSVFIP